MPDVYCNHIWDSNFSIQSRLNCIICRSTWNSYDAKPPEKVIGHFPVSAGRFRIPRLPPVAAIKDPLKYEDCKHDWRPVHEDSDIDHCGGCGNFSFRATVEIVNGS